MTEVNTHDEGAVAGAPYTGDTLPERAPAANHGRTGAGWTLFVGGAIAALIAGVGFVGMWIPLIAIGGAVAVVTIVASIALRAAGYGQVQRVQARE